MYGTSRYLFVVVKFNSRNFENMYFNHLERIMRENYCSTVLYIYVWEIEYRNQ